MTDAIIDTPPPVSAIDPANLDPFDRKVFDWLTQNMGVVTGFVRHPRWRPGWDAQVIRDGVVTPLYIRGPRGDSYVSPVDMIQEGEIHRAFEANAIPAPRLLGVIDDPLSLVLEHIPGRINSATIADEDVRRQVREAYIALIARLHQVPLAAFAKVGLPVPTSAQDIALALYQPAIDIFHKTIGRPFPLMRFIADWLHRNVPRDRTKAAFINPDAGQFLFEDDRVTGLIDFEVSSFGDPAAELAGLRIRDTAEPLGDISALIDHYERLTGDRISKRLIEYHTAGFCGVNGFLLWPLAFQSSPEQDYVAYMQFAVSATRFSISAIAAHDGVALTDPDLPVPRQIGFDEAARKLVAQVEALPGGSAAADYQRDSAAALARYLRRWATYGAQVAAADMDDVEALLGQRFDDDDAAMAALDAFVAQAGPEMDSALTRHFHRWLKRQNFLLRDCGDNYRYIDFDLQPIPPR
ncbi:phosphotransferase [Sphingobium sp.]|uniref:phosphotransferase n=1 Tax=Sphingobium TaxID=165695 RepID=UPI001A20D08F|nr:phosphotransferase [Sphingobium sp.]MBJ7375725.1 phosphotransferase [Sphingobium sp.]